MVERLDVKRELWARAAAHCRADAILSTNTSGIPVGDVADGWPAQRRARWLGTHFFNPPRYLSLLELIPTADTDPAVVALMAAFGDRVLGKGVVVAKDTPNFIGNHLALHGVAAILRAVESGRYSIDEVDAITGRAIGRPASATFRTMDIAGLDVLAHVLRNLEERLERPEDRAWFRTPDLLAGRLAAGALGEKAGRGFYERRKDAAGASAIFTFDPASGEYLPQRKPSFPSIEAARSLDDSAARVRALFAGTDRVGQFLRETLAPTLVYAARVAPDIAHSVDDVDRVMRWGFGWDLGPFELIDAIGVRAVVDAAAAHGTTELPPLLATALAAGRDRVRDGALAAGRAGPRAAPLGQGLARGRRHQSGRQPRRPGRRRAAPSSSTPR